jgi:hypothetical protein
MRSLRPAFRSLILLWLFTASAAAQSVTLEGPQVPAPRPATIEIPLVVPAGTPLRVALEQRVRIRAVGDAVQATLTHAIYAFDQEVVPAGSGLTGKVTRIDAVTKKRRFLGILNGDFTPARAYELEFDSLTLPDGRQMVIATQVSPGVAEVVRLVSDPAKEKKRNAVAKAASDAKKQASDTVRGTIRSIKSPGRWARIKRFLAAQLPFRRQYIEPGTRFTAELEGALDFGAVTRTSEELAELGAAPAEDSWLQARLSAEVTSATAQPGTPVEAIVTAPLFSPEEKLVFPAGSKLIGEVVYAKPARKLHRNGELRVAFKRIELPNGLAQAVQASLASMEVDRAAGLQLDSEGGAEATDSKARYLSTAFAIAAAALASQREVEAGEAPETNPGAQTAAGGTGFRLVGALTSFAIGSPVFSTVLGAYGAALAIHRNFLGPGREVNLPMHTPLEISFGKPRPAAEKEP